MTKLLGGIFFGFSLLSLQLHAQNHSIKGTIVDKTSEHPIQNANVKIYNGNILLYHTISDSIGRFSISVKLTTPSIIVTFTSLNYTSLQISTQLNEKSVKDLELGRIMLEPRKIQLNEVVIQAKKRYRDTTKIDLSKEKFERSVMIDDLFSANLGFSKNQNGQLYYKNKLVSNLKVNGDDFFGKNNMDIYQLLPALALDNIEITETNIDSLSNRTLLRPVVKVDLKLKPQYSKGRFGNGNIGGGSSARYIVTGGLYSYKNKQQLSLGFNTNNINVDGNTLQDPKINFSANGNNVKSSNISLNYRNIVFNKLEFNLDIKGKLENKNNISESERIDENINLHSLTFNSSRLKLFNISGSKFSTNYNIDSLNIIKASLTYDHSNTQGMDSTSYLFKSNNSTSNSNLNKKRELYSDQFNANINYQKSFGSRKGRLFSIDLNFKKSTYTNNEVDNIYNSVNENIQRYFIKGKRLMNDNDGVLNLAFTEPIKTSGSFNFSLAHEHQDLRYLPKINSDTIIDIRDLPVQLINDFIKPGIKIQNTFNKFSLDAEITGILDIRSINQNNKNTKTSFLNQNFSIKTDYKINSKKNLTLELSGIANYPDNQLLTNFNSSFDIISQTQGNIKLRPENKTSLKLYYSERKTESENITINAQFDHYSSKFGYRIGSSANSIQSTVTDNISSSNSAQLSIALNKSISENQYINFSSGVNYQESPSLINDKLNLNKGWTFNQSISTSFNLVKSIFSISPILAASYSIYLYDSNPIKITTITYSDKLSLAISNYQLNLYPLYNYNHSISNNKSFSMNGEIKKDIFKKYGVVWIQAYDIFNSFNYYNNYFGASYYQSTKYSNIKRFFIIGLSFKFNNIN